MYVTCAAISATRNVNRWVPVASVQVVGAVNVQFTAATSVTLQFPVHMANVSVHEVVCAT